ncbi:MAG: ABC transporter ATP-binding protein [Candidatus Kerfeldbacteria bacterium]|nr:ABC transporter ATP-binding protein [Candidatus Kerfeldbacteria bacterium]
MHAIELKNLRKTYSSGTEALKGIDLRVAEGDFFALLGVNGAGKSTTIGILTGLVTKTSGTVSVFGYDLDAQLDLVKQQIGVVPQEFNFNIFEKVIDIVIQQAGFYGIPRSVALPRAEEILKKLQLWEKRDVQSKELSGGMKRRLMIARALVHQPRLLILDEPTAGVDVELRRGMWEYLQELNSSGVTILLTTHYLEEVEQLCKNAAVIHGGKIMLSDTVRNLTSSLEKELYTATVSTTVGIETLGASIVRVDEHTLTITLAKGESITDAVAQLQRAGITVTALRPTSNRMEQLFLNAIST